MSVLSVETQKQVEARLIKDGLLTAAKAKELREKAQASNTPFLSLLTSEGHISNEVLTKIIANSTNVPYVNLSSAKIEPDTLALLPQDIAARYMAVPLGEMQHRL